MIFYASPNQVIWLQMNDTELCWFYRKICLCFLSLWPSWFHSPSTFACAGSRPSSSSAPLVWGACKASWSHLSPWSAEYCPRTFGASAITRELFISLQAFSDFACCRQSIRLENNPCQSALMFNARRQSERLSLGTLDSVWLPALSCSRQGFFLWFCTGFSCFTLSWKIGLR